MLGWCGCNRAHASSSSSNFCTVLRLVDAARGVYWGPHLTPVAGCPPSPLRFAGIRSDRHGLRRGLHHGHGHRRYGDCHIHLLVNFIRCDLLGGDCMAVEVAATVVDIGQVVRLVVEYLSPPIAQSVAAFGLWHLPACYCARRVIGRCFGLLPAPRRRSPRSLRILYLLLLHWHFLHTQNFRPLPMSSGGGNIVLAQIVQSCTRFVPLVVFGVMWHRPLSIGLSSTRFA